MNEDTTTTNKKQRQQQQQPATSTINQGNNNAVAGDAAEEGENKPRRPIFLPNDVKCILIHGYGSVKQMKAISIPRPHPGDGEVLVHVRSSGVNFLDLSIRQGQFQNLPKLPFSPGFECAGEVVQLGPNTSGYQLGDRVICLPRLYAYSEYLAINTNLIFRIPDQMSFRDAAAISYSYLTAYILLFELGGIKNGQSVLFHSAGGSVGIALTQLLKLVSNVKIIATCSKSKHSALRHHIDHLIESNGPVDYVQEVKKVCPEGVDLVLDCLSGDNTNKGIFLTKPLGKYIIYGISKNLDGESKNYLALAKNWWHVDKVSPLKLYDENKSISGFNLHNFLFNQSFNSRRYIINIYSKIFGLYQDGVVKPVIDSVHSFEDVHLALGRLQERQNIGKVLLEPYLDKKSVAICVKSKKKKGGDDEGHSSDTSGPDEEPDQNDFP